MTESSALPYPPSQSNHELSKGLKWSALIHTGLILTIIIQGLVFPGKPKPYIPTLRVDLVGLPDVLKKDVQNPSRSQAQEAIAEVFKQAEQKAKNEAREKARSEKSKKIAQKDEMVIKPKRGDTQDHQTEKRNKRALDRIKALAKVQEFAEETAPRRAAPVKGNQISPGSSLSGEAREAAEAHYYDLLRDRLQENWSLPPWLSRQKSLSAQVQIFIDSHGKLKRLQFTKGSGNVQFDDAVKKAIQDSQPFPVPPKDLLLTMGMDGILVGFPL